jgi:arginase
MQTPAASRVQILGVPLDLGGARRGVDMGPSALRIAGLGEQLSALGRTVVDKGNLVIPISETLEPGDASRRYIREIARVCEELYEQVAEALEAGALPIVLGGDHSLAAGSVGASADYAAARGRPIGLLWLDAHGDMNTPATTTTGNVHGMPLAALLGSEPAELARIGGGPSRPSVEPARTALIGIRNLDPLEKARIRASGVHVFTMKDIDRHGIATVMEDALARIGRDRAGVHVSFDLDVCDPTIAPGVGTPVNGGLDYREAHMVMEMIADSGLLLALDLVETNPILDSANQTATLGVELILSALGKQIL